MRYVFITIYVLIFFLGLVNCNPAGENGQDNPIPALSSISPESKVAHMPSFTLTAKGSNFVSGSNIVFNGTEKQTTFVSSSELTCQIDPEDTVLSSSAVQESMLFEIQQSEAVPVLVRNPSPGGGDSNSIEFTIRDNHSFDFPENISNNSGKSYSPDIATDSAGNINVVWQDYTLGNSDIFFSRSTDDGISWSQTVNISNTSGSSFCPVISVDKSEDINVVWYDTSGNMEIYFSRSTDDGISWSKAVNISNNSGCSVSPAIAVDNAGNINVVWQDSISGNWDIYFSRSTDDGVTWSQVVKISNKTGNSYSPAIAVDSAGNINVVWQNCTPGNYKIYFSRSTDDGVTWSQTVNISNNSAFSYDPAIAVDSEGSINVVWNGSISYDVYFSRSTDDGATWSQVVNISNNSTFSTFHAIAIDRAGNINVVWSDNISGNYEIYFSRSTDDGVTWSQTVNISNNWERSYCTAIAVDRAGNINVVWWDKTPGNDEIFFISSTR